MKCTHVSGSNNFAAFSKTFLRKAGNFLSGSAWQWIIQWLLVHFGTTAIICDEVPVISYSTALSNYETGEEIRVLLEK